MAILRAWLRSPKVTLRRAWGHFLTLFGLGLRLYAWRGQAVADRGWAERNGAIFLTLGIVLLVFGGRRRRAEPDSPAPTKEADPKSGA